MKTKTIPAGKIGLGASLALLSGGAAQAAKPAAKQSPKRPNIVLVIADDCRHYDLGCYGSPDAITPNIDHLASQGVRFERFFQATAMSSPTRHCLLTGLYPVRSGAYPNHTRLDDGVRTLPAYLKQAGYRVALQGKRHIAPIEAFPFEYLSEESLRSVHPEKIEPFLADVARTGEPFFLYVASTEPHDPWTLGDQNLWNPDELTLPSNLVDTPATRKQFRNYLAEINVLDNQVGAVDSLLHKYGLDENTVFIFTSEQGYSFPFAKWTCYDEGLQTGFVIRWPGVVKPGTTTDAMCEYVDMTRRTRRPQFPARRQRESQGFQTGGLRHPDQPRHPRRTGILRHPLGAQRPLRLHPEPHARSDVQMYVHTPQTELVGFMEGEGLDRRIRPPAGRALPASPRRRALRHRQRPVPDPQPGRRPAICRGESRAARQAAPVDGAPGRPGAADGDGGQGTHVPQGSSDRTRAQKEKSRKNKAAKLPE